MKKLFATVVVLFIALSCGCTSNSTAKVEAVEFEEISAPADIPSNYQQVATSYRCIVDDNAVIAPVFESTDDNCFYFYFNNSFTKITDIDGNPLDFDTIDTYFSPAE
jgi:hypothetical protein